MAKGAFLGVNGVARKISNKYIGVNGVARKISNGYIGVNGVARQFWPGGEPLSGLPAGSIVATPLNGTLKNFIVVHQGRPSTAYDSSCNGTWLLLEDIYEKRNLDDWAASYEESDMHSYLTSTFLGLFDSAVQKVIKQVKIPYRQGSMLNGPVLSGSSGLSTKVFLLSYTEVGYSSSSDAPVEGASLAYFNGAANSARIGYLNGTATSWWLRTPYIGQSNYAPMWCVGAAGGGVGINDVTTASRGVRPAIVLPSNTLYINENGVNVLVA